MLSRAQFKFCWLSLCTIVNRGKDPAEEGAMSRNMSGTYKTLVIGTEAAANAKASTNAVVLLIYTIDDHRNGPVLYEDPKTHE